MEQANSRDVSEKIKSEWRTITGKLAEYVDKNRNSETPLRMRSEVASPRQGRRPVGTQPVNRLVAYPEMLRLALPCGSLKASVMQRNVGIRSYIFMIRKGKRNLNVPSNHWLSAWSILDERLSLPSLNSLS
jgi:hypothetical protein